MHKWSLGGLIGAFVDLCTVYLFLCASAVAYMASKLLGLFGLCLPCPCRGLFIAKPNKNLCFLNLFIDYPMEKVADVQLSVRTKFPFNDSICGKDHKCNLNLRLIGEREKDVMQLEGEASCYSISDARKSSNILRIRGELNTGNDERGKEFLYTKLGRFDMKGKEIMYQKPRSGLHHRRKGDSDQGKQHSSIASYDSRFGENQGDQESSPSVNNEENELADDYPRLLDDEIYSHLDHEEPRTSLRLGQRLSNSIVLNEICDEDEETEEDAPSLEELRGDGGGPIDDEKNTIGLLIEALKEERAASTSLYLELDKERSAAASAADEAMAMIQRLQEEKASIEMEARQYQRIIEDKSAYDAEEMNILKEIIIRREWEKHFLEKEVETYRQMIGNEQPTLNTRDMLDSHILNSLLDTNEDPVLLLQQLSASIDEKKGSVGALTESSIEGYNASATSGKQVHSSRELPHLSGGKDDEQQEIGDKMVPIGNDSLTPPENAASLEKLTWSSKIGNSLEMSPEENISLVEKGKSQVNKHVKMLEQSKNDVNQGTETPCNSSEKAPLVHDVHVVVSQSNTYNQINRSKEELFPQSSTVGSTKIHVTKDASSEASIFERVSAVSDALNSSNLDTGVPIKRSSSDIACRLPPLAPKSKLQLLDPRKNPMFAIDYERSKIESEIGLLRERLRVVQEGRGKLNLSVDHREREKYQLNLLEDIACQLQEIRQLTEPGKAVRQTSLPLPSSKAAANRRHYRSASLEPHSSSGIS